MNNEPMMTYQLGGDLYVKPVMARGNERLWLLFERGISHPLIVMTDLQMKAMANAYDNEVELTKS